MKNYMVDMSANYHLPLCMSSTIVFMIPVSESGGIMLKDMVEIVVTAVIIIAAVAICGWLEMGELEGIGRCATSIW